MSSQPQETPDYEEARKLNALIIESLSQQVKRDAHRALSGRANRLQDIAAEFAHLGAVANELLSLALQDVERTPDYFAALTRTGLTEALQEKREEQPPDVIEGTATRVGGGERAHHER